METKTKSFPGLTGNQLKILALITMTCDHVGLQLLPQWDWLRIIGRLALPVYAYMIAEGCRYTHRRGAYLGKLLGMAALCQIGYYVAQRSLYQCILVTFSLSIGLIYALEDAQKRRGWISILEAAGALAAAAFVCAGLPWLLPRTDFAVDYGFAGVLLPVLVHFGRSKWEKLGLLSLGLCLLALECGGIQWFALLSVPLLALYNGRRGKWKIGGLFYIYYPVHLVIIYGLSLLL